MSLIDLVTPATPREHAKPKTTTTKKEEVGAFAQEVNKAKPDALEVEKPNDISLNLVPSGTEKNQEIRNAQQLEKESVLQQPDSTESLLPKSVEPELTSSSSQNIEANKDQVEVEVVQPLAAVQKPAHKNLEAISKPETSKMLRAKSIDGLHPKQIGIDGTASAVHPNQPLASKATMPTEVFELQKNQQTQTVVGQIAAQGALPKRMPSPFSTPIPPTGEMPIQLQHEPLKPALDPKGAKTETVIPSSAVVTKDIGQQTVAVLPTPFVQQSLTATTGLGFDIENMSAANSLRSEHLVAVPQNAPYSALPMTGTVTTTTAPPTQQILAQVFATDDATKPTSIDVRLDPEDLGKVRLNFLPRESGMLVVVSAERAETLDLLRRNAEDLKAGLLDMNFEGADLEFSNAPEDTDWGSDKDEPVEQLPPVQSLSSTPVLAAVDVHTDRLDIRL